MSYLTADADDQQNSTETDDSDDETAITGRIEMYDEAALLMGPANILKHILEWEDGFVPEESPLRDEYSRLRDEQGDNYKLREENHNFGLREYLSEVGWPDCEQVVDPEEFAEEGLKVHPDYSEDGRCYPDPSDADDGYPIPSEYQFPAFYPDSNESESDDTATEGSEAEDKSQDLTTISGIGEKTAEKIEAEYGISTLGEAKDHDAVNPNNLPGVGEKTLRKLHISIAEPEDDEEAEESDDGFTFDTATEGSEDTDEAGSMPEIVKENPEILTDMDPDQIRALKE